MLHDLSAHNRDELAERCRVKVAERVGRSATAHPARPGTEVLLTAYGTGARVHIEVQDHCGGLPAGTAETMFLPFSQSGSNRPGIGLHLTIAKQSLALFFQRY